MQFLFIDNEKLCLYKDGKLSECESTYLKKYRETSLTSAKNSEWKRKGKVERMLNDIYLDIDNEEIFAKIYAIAPTNKETEFVYSFGVNDSSGIYLKYLNDEKNLEAHIISSNQVEFTSFK